MPDEQKTAFPAILIPSFTGEVCLAMAKELTSRGYYVIAVCEERDVTDAEAAREAGCVVLSAEKGQALRAGLEYFHKELQWLPGVVCLNVEEGYTVEDVLRVAAAMEANPGRIIVAARAANRGLGLKERLVKACAGKFFSALHGRAVKDPWAGLRAVPSAAVPSLLDLNGDGRRFAFNILLNMQHKGIKAVSVPVSALYDAGGEQERGERSKDVFRILVLPLKFVAASCMATACDYSAFGITYYIIHLTWPYAQTAGRITGATVGFFINKNIVFKRKSRSWHDNFVQAIQYAALALVNYGASIALMSFFINYLHFYTIVAKFTSDILLYTTNYFIQREFIFRRKAQSVN